MTAGRGTRARRGERIARGCFAAAIAAIATGCGSGSHAVLPGDDESNAVTSDGGESGDDAGDGGGSIGAGFGSDASAGGSVGKGCATASAAARRQPAYLLFVLDGSDSMNQENKWAAVVPALRSIFGEMDSAADPSVGAGLIVFPDQGGPYPAAADVPVAFVDKTQEAALDARLGVGLSLGTPTESAIQGGYGELEGFEPKAPLVSGGEKVLILITDGVPTDACSTALGLTNIATNACVTLAASKLTEAPSSGGPIETFVVGVGDFPSTSKADFDPTFLGHVAQAGGTGPAKCNPDETTSDADLCYFEIDPSKSTSASDLQKKFQAALDTIRGEVLSCTFPLESTGLGAIDPMLVNVEIDGKVLEQDPADGWTYDDPTAPTAIILHGASCNTAQTDVTAQVNILVGCYTQTK